MRKHNLITISLLLNAVLLIRFSFRRWKLREQVNFISHEIARLNDSAANLQIYCDEATKSAKQVTQSLRTNFLQLKMMTEYTKRSQIRIKGVPERESENLFIVLKDIFGEMGISISSRDISRVTRVATATKQGAPRVIAAELSSQKVYLRYIYNNPDNYCTAMDCDFKLKTKVLIKASTALLDKPYAIQDDVTNHAMPESFAEVEKRDFPAGCGYIRSVSEPVTVAKSKKTFGAWLQDSANTVAEIKSNYVWILPHFYETNVVEEYASISDLRRRRIHQKYELPYSWAGTGHVVYNGCLYYAKFGSNEVIRYEFATRSVLKEKHIPRALYGNDAPYQWSGSTDIDLSADYESLYVIYATYENTMDIVLGQIDPVTLNLIRTWKTNWRKQWSGNAFVMCGVLYVLKKYDESNSILSYAYDTEIMRYTRIQIPFTNKYEWNTMLEYNPRTNMIYAWDRGYLVTYNVTLSDNIAK